MSADRLAESSGPALPPPAPSLWSMFAHTAVLHPAREAVVSLWQRDPAAPSTPRLAWTYAELRARAERLADWLRAQGCTRGTPLAAYLGNSTEWALFFWACARLGLVFVPLDPRAMPECQLHVHMLQPRVVVVQDLDTAERFDEEIGGCLLSDVLRIQCSGGLRPGWVATFAEQREPQHLDDPPQPLSVDPPALIIFTSGTTSTPKACAHTARNLAAQTFNYDPDPDPAVVERWLIHTPVSHIFAINHALRAWRDAGTAVFPAAAFEVDATLRALVEEECSVMSAVPAITRVLVGHPQFPGPQALSLRLVTMAGSMIRPADIQLCKTGLGAQHVIQSYGMSETGPAMSWRRDDPMLVDGRHGGVGKVLPGVKVRVCEPQSRRVLARDVVGELHVGGDALIDGYLGAGDNSAYYTDSAGSWFVTGDQGRMDEDGVVYLLGRYKDLIIRGGENISPARIEEVLAELEGVLACVVGIADEIAGQLPVAVVKIESSVTKAEIFGKARQLGPLYALGDVLTLNQVGLETFPVTSLGKVKKELVREAVLKHRSSSSAKSNKGEDFETLPRMTPCVGEENVVCPDSPCSENTAPRSNLADQLQTIWKSLVGVRPNINDAITSYADSITLLRYCDRVMTETGKRLYLQDFGDHDTVLKQVALLETRDKQQTKFLAQASAVFQMEGSVKTSPEDMVAAEYFPSPPATPDPNKARLLKHANQDVGVDESQIEYRLPIKSSLQRLAVGIRPQSFLNRQVFDIRDRSGAQVQEALRAFVESRPMLRTVTRQGSQSGHFHLVLRPSQWLFDSIVRVVSVTDAAAAEQAMDDPAEIVDRRPPNFMFRALVVTVQSTNEVKLCLRYNHSIMDAVSLMMWHRQLDRLLESPHTMKSDQEPLLPTPFKFFADLLSINESNALGQAAVEFHARRLRGISRCKDALWPEQRAPGWMISENPGATAALAARRDEIRQQVWQGKWILEHDKSARLARVVCLPGLDHLQRQHGIDACTMVKSAIAVFNALQTRSRYAIFTSWESGRRWPFVPEWMDKAVLPPAMGIDGPTVDWVVNMVEVDRQETVGQLVRRFQAEWQLTSQHTHAPWSRVLEELRDEAATAIDASYRQAFVWDVSMGLSRGGHDYRVMKPVARQDWADYGFCWNAFMIDQDNLQVVASWDTAQMNKTEVEGHCDGLVDVLRQMASIGSWDKKVGSLWTTRAG